MSMTVPTAVPTSGLRRITVVAPRARMDVALPVQCTLAELIPQLVRLAGAPMRPGPDGTGWALSRVGGPPLPPGLTVAAASLADGEVLHLSARVGPATPLLFDDVVDAIASAARTRRGAWRPTVGRRLALVSAAVLFTGMTAVLLALLSGTVQAPVAAGAVAVGLLLCGLGLARAYRDVPAACALAGAGTVAALVAGLAALPPHTVWPLGPASLAVGFAAVTLHAVLAAVVVHRHVWFVAVAVASGAGALITACVVLFDARPASAAAVAATVLTALTAFAPLISLRMAGLPLPNVPEDMDAFRADERPALGSEVLGVTSAAARLLSGLVTALGVASAGCCAVVIGDDSSWAAVLVGLIGVAWLLRSRSYAAATQRVSLVAIGLVVLAGLGVRAVSTMDTQWLWLLTALLASAAGLCVVYAGRVVRQENSPFRARWLDILEYLVLISLLPVTGAVLDIYNSVRDAVS
jgi:type VII secretion integral membrane protein EccD